jgi:hypothetical protein
MAPTMTIVKRRYVGLHLRRRQPPCPAVTVSFVGILDAVSMLSGLYSAVADVPDLDTMTQVVKHRNALRPTGSNEDRINAASQLGMNKDGIRSFGQLGAGEYGRARACGCTAMTEPLKESGHRLGSAGRSVRAQSLGRTLE